MTRIRRPDRGIGRSLDLILCNANKMKGRGTLRIAGKGGTKYSSKKLRGGRSRSPGHHY